MSQNLKVLAPSLSPFNMTRLRDLQQCERRFWLRNVARVAWPADPIPPEIEDGAALGQQFHQLMQRHFLKLETHPIPDPLRPFWDAWQNHPLPLPVGQLLPEITLSIPFLNQRLLARFDLLVIADDSRILIADWKTERRPRSRLKLESDFQTRLYPFVLVEGGQALEPIERPIEPNQVTMVYWQANEPDRPVSFPYSAQQHSNSRAFFSALISRAAALDPALMPPLVDELALCGRCLYRTYCGREVPPEPNWEAEVEPHDDELLPPP